jgi:AcrR family transcriptional regulator
LGNVFKAGLVADEKELISGRILDAARKHFAHYGYPKTTMADIADACGMSPGNIYRFFPGKLDIAEAIAREDERLRLAEMEKIASAPRCSARKKLCDFLFAELRSTFRKFDEDPRALEVARIISEKRPEFGDVRVAAERGMIERILVEGSEFNVSDAENTAEMIHSATLKFRFPQRWTHASLETLERELKGVLKLIMDGLTPRAGAEQ